VCERLPSPLEQDPVYERELTRYVLKTLRITGKKNRKEKITLPIIKRIEKKTFLYQAHSNDTTSNKGSIFSLLHISHVLILIYISYVIGWRVVET